MPPAQQGLILRCSTYLGLGQCCQPCYIFYDYFRRPVGIRGVNGTASIVINSASNPDGVNLPGSDFYQFAEGSWECYKYREAPEPEDSSESSTSFSSNSSSSSSSSSAGYPEDYIPVLKCNTEDSPLSFFRAKPSPWLVNCYASFMLPQVDDYVELTFKGNHEVSGKVTRTAYDEITHSLKVGSNTRTRVFSLPSLELREADINIEFYLPERYPEMATGAKVVMAAAGANIYLDANIDDETRHTEMVLKATSGAMVRSIQIWRAISRCTGGVYEEYRVSDSDGYISSDSSTSTSSSSDGGHSSSSPSSTSDSSTSMSSDSSVVDESSSSSSLSPGP